MKKYGVYFYSKLLSQDGKTFLMRECNSLREAVKEGYRLARCFKNCHMCTGVYRIVGDNSVVYTGKSKEYIAYYVFKNSIGIYGGLHDKNLYII